MKIKSSILTTKKDLVENMKSVYPAVFHPEEIGYSVSFPDLPGCFSQGDSLAEAIDMATEALRGYLATRLDLDLPIAPPSKIEDIDKEDGFVNYISADPACCRKKSKMIKKTLTIPEWLNIEAEKAGVNFSATLQVALRSRLGL